MIIMNETLTEKIMIAAIAGVFGVVPIFLQWLGSIAKRRERATKLANLLTELEFLEHWQTLHLQLGGDLASSPDQTEHPLRAQLQSLLHRYHMLAGPALQTTDRPHGSTSFLRRLFLLYRPNTLKAWLWHTMFYSLFLMCLGILIVGVNQDGLSSEFAAGLFGALILFGPPLLLVHYLARRAQQAPAV
jgi:hypothetical protein